MDLIVAVPRCSWGNRKGQHPESAGPSSFSTSGQSVSKSVFRIGSAGLISLARHKTAILGSALPHSGKRWPGGTGGQPVLRRIVAVGWPSHLRRWCCSLVPVEEVTAHPPPGSPHYARGRPLFRYGEENLLSYTTRKKGVNGDADYRFFLKYFFMASIPHKTEWRTALLSTPSARAISR